MRNALNLYRNWEERRWLKWSAWWERKRADGKDRYVRWVTLGWGGVMLNIFVLCDYLTGAGFSLTKFLIMVPLCFAGGRFVGTRTWLSNESRYQRYLSRAVGRGLTQ